MTESTEELKPTTLRGVLSMEYAMPNPFSRDLSDMYFILRGKKIADFHVRRSIILKRFLKLASVHSKVYIWHKLSQISYLQYLADRIPYVYSKRFVAEEEKKIIGLQNWQDDEDVTQCGLCRQEFNFLNRKHHCRLCGTIVDELTTEFQGSASSCSALVPIPLLLRKLPNLNYSPDIISDWDDLCDADSNDKWYSLSFSFRCCKVCKNALIHEIKTANETPFVSESSQILRKYDEFLHLKKMVTNLFCRYGETGHTDKELVTLRSKILDCVKELEHRCSHFKSNSSISNEKDVQNTAAGNSLMINVHKSMLITLQEVLLKLKTINRKSQTDLLTGPPSSSKQREEDNATVIQPKLTKRVIRERREQLMVLNEQKFIIEGLLDSTRAQRKFDEVATLEESKIDLVIKIEELEAELGEFGF